MVKLAFCNDCDLQTWAGYKAVHATLDALKLPAGDSFWLFDPSGNEMGLFRRDCTEKGPRHDELLEEIRAGRIDVFHSAGQYSARFGQGLRPNRKSIAEALDYLAKHARIPRIWSNHGDELCVQNIGAATPLGYHCGDDPASDCYILDLFFDAGVKYFWTDGRLVVDAGTPHRIVATEETRSKHSIKVFSRFIGKMPWAPNAQNFSLQLNDQNLDCWLANDQNIVIYQHWGCHHDENRWAYSPKGDPLTEESRHALEWLSSRCAEGKVEVVRLIDLLESEAAKGLSAETDRIARALTRSRMDDADKHYYVQFHNHTIPYFQSRVEHLNPRGHRALDAGCGAGQWSLCLTERFDEVVSFDSSADAISTARNIATAARLNVDFSVGDIYRTGYPSDHFDFAICYGVIFLVEALPALKELYRVLAPGASCFFSVNGDGWYQYLIEDRLSDRDDDEKQLYIDPLYNAYVARCGGTGVLKKRWSKRHFVTIERALKERNRQAVIERLAILALDKNRPEVIKILRRFADYTLLGLASSVLTRISQGVPLGQQVNSTLKARAKVKLREAYYWSRSLLRPQSVDLSTNLQDVPLFNRPYTPEEFERIGRLVGFTDFRWGRDASLSVDANASEPKIRPLHELYYQGNLRVWECLLTKPKAGSVSSA
jgi:SAM-dependent methyltransferase